MRTFILLLLTLYFAPIYSVNMGNDSDLYCIYNHRTTKTNQKYPSVNL